MDVLVTCKYEEDPIKKKALELSVVMDTRVPIRSGPKPNSTFPHPNDGSDKIIKFRNDWTTDCGDIQVENFYTQTARLVNYKLAFEPSAQEGSAELKSKQ